ncbi:TPA: DNA cytosine methyltransferase [Listeria monocytogenes]|nr:DNA cytosine methyltransferase [Listeria monocytogenes]
MKYRAISLFAGVGGLDLGFEQTGKFETIWANEFDEKAALTYRSNFNNTLSTLDIHEVNKKELPKANIVLSGFPCQAFSVAGYRLGFEDERGGLFFETLKVINSVNPEVVFLENVKNLVGHDKGRTFRIIFDALEQHGYFVKYQTLNAKDYGNIPQNRERIYIVGFRNKSAFEKFDFPKPIELKKKLSDVIDYDSQLEDRYYYSPEKHTFYDLLEQDIVSQDTLYQWRRQYVRENKSNVSPTLTANMGTGGHNVPLILSKHGIRKLTPRECFNLQGYPPSYILPNIAISHLYKQAGNSVVVPVIKRIAENISMALEEASKIDLIQLDI